MMKVTFYVSSGYVNSKRKETFTFPDDMTSEEIEENYKGWLDINNVDMGWYIEEE